MEKFVNRMNAKYIHKHVNPEQAHRLIHGDRETVDTSELDEQIDRVYTHIAPSRFPEYKSKKLRKSIAGLLPRYGEALLKLSDEDVNNKGTIKESSLSKL